MSVGSRAEKMLREGWTVVMAAFLIQLVVMGSSLYSFGVFVKPLAEEFGVGRATVSAAYVVYTLVGAGLGPFAGVMMARRPIKHVMLVGAVLTALGFGLLSRATAIWQVYLYFGVIVGAGNLLTGIMPCAAIIVGWFEKNRGVALGVSLFGASIGGPVFVPLATAIDQALGWRATALGFAAIVIVVLPPLIWFLISERLPKSGTAATGVKPADAPKERGVTVALLRDPRLWFAMGLMGFGVAPATAVIQTLYSFATDIGYSPETAAGVVAGMTFLAALSKPFSGRLADRLGVQVVILTSLGLQAVGLVLTGMTTTFWIFALGVAFVGVGYGGLAPLISLLLSTLFGALKFSRVMGLLTLLLAPFSLVGFPLASWIRDQSSSYQLAYLLFVVFLAVATISLLQLPLSGRQVEALTQETGAAS